MTHQIQSNPFDQMLQVLEEHGFDGLAHALEILFNEAMKIERSAVLGAEPYERSEQRRGYANGFKPKTLSTCVGGWKSTSLRRGRRVLSSIPRTRRPQ